jgi:hypothetical protein
MAKIGNGHVVHEEGIVVSIGGTVVYPERLGWSSKKMRS